MQAEVLSGQCVVDQWDQVDRAERAAQGRRHAERLTAAGVVGVALSWVDTAGISRVKAVPTAALAHAAAWGVGATPVLDFFLPDDSITIGRYRAGPTGDLRLLPDLARLVPLAAQPGWAWAPVDRWTQEGARLAAAGLSARLTFGPELADTVVTVRRAEIERFAGASPEQIVTASRWTP